MARGLRHASRRMTASDWTANDVSLSGSDIFVVDDHEDSAMLFKAVLELCGATAHVFSNVADALAGLAAGSPAAIVSDLELQGGRVEDLLAAAKRDRLPVLLLTGHARPDDLVTAMELGFDDYRVKPIDPMDLCRAVAKLLAHRRESG